MKLKSKQLNKAVAHGIDTLFVNGFTVQTCNTITNGKNPGTHFHQNKKTD